MIDKIQKFNFNNCCGIHDEEWLEEQYNSIREQNSSYAMISINVKKFKYFNLKYGWTQGNEILMLIYKEIQNDLSEGEAAAHICGDQFSALYKACFLPDLNEFIKERLMRLVDRLFEIEDERIYNNIYFSIGIYEFAESNCGFHEAQERANFARMEEPNLKKRTFSVELYSDKLMSDYIYQHEMVISTANALSKNEYAVYIQPKIDVQTRKIVGGEALLRRFDRDGNMIPLSDYLPILNDSGYIRKVDWFVFETVCSILHQRFQNQTPIVPISFNISRDFFYDNLMSAHYTSTLEKYEIPKQYIEFELMESISMDDTEQMIKVISTFKNAGFACALDDFGNGYSSFCVLLNSDIDYIKMDRQFFVDNLNGDSRLVIKSIVELAKSLGLKVIAEGVETQDQVDYLTEINCDMIQGYYFYRPMPIAEFFQMLTT